MYILKGRVIDGNGGAPIERGAVVIEDEKIVKVCDQRELVVPEGAVVYEVPDSTIMPGLIDLHVHVGMGGGPNASPFLNLYEQTCKALAGLKRSLNQGFTSIRDCAGIGMYIRDAWEEGLFDSPRINSAGRFISQTGGHGDQMKGLFTVGIPKNKLGTMSYIADGEAEVRYYTRYNLAQGADFVKIATSSGVGGRNKNLDRLEYTEPEVRAAVEEAEHFGTYVASHCVSNSGIKLAARCGVRTIEHASFLDQEGADLMSANNCWMIPTFAVAWLMIDNIDKLPPLTAKKVQIGNEAHMRTFEYALKNKVKIGYGTDLEPGDAQGKEFECLSKLGMSPMEVIVSATKTGAEVLCRDDIGTLEAGKLADVIIVKGNPLEDIMLMCNPDNVRLVIQNGNVKKDTTQS